ncbi:MAG: OmpA family protein [Elusimicrobia bacterium]|nr:OmpA family protein [Elusimicrobiota bacterium]
MKNSLCVAVVALLLSGCASGKIKKLQAQADLCETNSGQLRQQIRAGEDKAAALQSQAKDFEAKAADLDAKLKAQQERIDSLAKSNQDLRSSLAANTGQLSGKVAELVKEKDELARGLDALKKDKIAADRTLANQKATLAAAKARLDELAAAAAAVKAEQDKAFTERTQAQARAHDDLGSLADAVLKEMQGEKARIEQDGDSVALTLQEPLLFKSNQAKLTDAGIALLDRLGRALQALGPRAVRVEGHSDNSTIKWELFGSFNGHWELSAARAAAVARYLHEHAGLDPRRLSAAGFGEFRPVKGNDTAAGREANRRVVLVVGPAAP